MTKQNSPFGVLALWAAAAVGLCAASCAAPSFHDLKAEKAALSRRLGPSASPQVRRDYGWNAMLLGDAAAGQEELARARAAGLKDARTLFGLALRAQDTLRSAEARDLWTTLIETYDDGNPWAPAVAEAAAHHLLSFGVDAHEDAAAERAYVDRLWRLWQSPGRSALPPEVVQEVAAFTGQLLRMQGRERDAQDVDTARGCSKVFFVSGPHGRLARLDQATPFSPDDPARDPERAAYRRQAVRGCELMLDGAAEKSRSGVIYALAWVEFPAATVVPLAIESGGELFSFYVDGALRYREEEPVRRRLLSLKVAAGWHAVSVKVSAPEGKAQLQIALPGGRFYDGPAASAPATPKRPERVALADPRPLSPVPLAPAAGDPARGTKAAQAAPRSGAHVLARLLLAEEADITGDTDAGIRSVEGVFRWAPAYAPLLLLQANLQAGDSSRPPRLIRDRVRRDLQRALELDPTLLRARMNLANMELQEEHAEQALALLDAAPAPASKSAGTIADRGEAGGWQGLLLRYRIFKARGWLHDAEDTLLKAHAVGPAACPPLEALVDLRREFKDEHGALDYARQLAACNPYSDRYADALRGAGDLAGAQSEYERLLRLDPESESLRQGLSETLALRGGKEALSRARDMLIALIARYPRTSFYRVRLANILLEQGQRDAAEAALRAGLLLSPESSDLHRALLALGVPSVMDPDRVDGRQVIREFAADKQAERPGEAAVIVLDRTVTRVFPTGARLTLTHNIMKVLTKDGIDKFGEVQIPEGADVLTLRTVKADGTTREPEEITEKETISAPDLEIGDYVEFEYVDRQAAPPSLPDGFLGERFFFASGDAPLHRTEYVLVTPWDMPLQLDLRGRDLQTGQPDLPQAVVQHRGGDRVTVWARRDVPRIFPEAPQSETLSSEWVPSVRPASGLTFERWRDFLGDRLYEIFRPNEELRRLALAEAGPPPAGQAADAPATLLLRARRLDAWVRLNIKAGGSLDEPATVTLARREGNRVVLLLALLRAAGVPAELDLVRPVTAPHLEGAIPDAEAFSEPVLAVGQDRGPKGPGGGPLLWIDPNFRHTPTGLVRPPLRGGKVLRLVSSSLSSGAPSVSVSGPAVFLTLDQESDGAKAGVARPASGATRPGDQAPDQTIDRRQMALEMHLVADGSGDVTVRETLSGWPALEWREELERLSDSQVRQELEQRSLGFFFPGASLEELHYGPLLDDNAPFVITYRFHAPRLARLRQSSEDAARRRTELVLPAPYPSFLARHYVGVPQRRTPLVLHYVVPTELDGKIVLPTGAGQALLSPRLALSGFGQFSQQVTSEATTAGATLRLHAQFSMPMLRVEPDHYLDFVGYAARVDSAEDAVAIVPIDQSPSAP